MKPKPNRHYIARVDGHLTVVATWKHPGDALQVELLGVEVTYSYPEDCRAIEILRELDLEGLLDEPKGAK